MSRDFSGLCDKGVMRIHGQEHLTVCHDPHKFSDHRFCDSGDSMFLICHVNSCDHMVNRFCVFVGEAPHGKPLEVVKI